MTRWIALGLCLCWWSVGVQAQTSTVHVLWDPPLSTDGIISYNLTVDNLPVISIPPAIDASCTCIRTAIAVAVGPHTLRVTSVYLLISTDPNSVTETLPTIATFTLNGGGQLKNVKIAR